MQLNLHLLFELSETSTAVIRTQQVICAVQAVIVYLEQADEEEAGHAVHQGIRPYSDAQLICPKPKVSTT